MIRRLLTLAAASAALMLVAVAPAAAAPSTDVIGGAPIGSDAEYPFLGAVLGNANPVTGFYCGSSLIASRWMLTAAHCVAPAENLIPKYVAIGTRDRSNPATQLIPVTGYFPHPLYNETVLQNDLMLLRLASTPVGITPLPRATAAEDPGAGNTATLVGWGLTVQNPTNEDDAPLIANKMTSEIVAQLNCAAAWEGISVVLASQICTFHDTPTFRSGCKGDSGGPLIFANRQVGIVSYGTSGCTADAPAVYTRVSSFNPWIDGTMQKSLVLENAPAEFGTVDTDGPAATQQITVRSQGDQPISITSATTTGEFQVRATTCSGPIAPDQSCTFDVAFDPSIGGTSFGTLKLQTDSAGTAVYTARLKGNGFGRSATPVKMNFKRKKIGRSGSKLKVTFRMLFKVPAGVTTSYACTGKLRSSVSFAGRSKANRTRVYALPGLLGRPPHCYSDFTVKLPRSAAGRRVKIKAELPANSVLVASKRSVLLRVK